MFVINYGHCYLLLFIVIYILLFIVIYCYLLLFIVVYCYLLFMIQQIKDGESSDEPRSYQFFVVTNA